MSEKRWQPGDPCKLVDLRNGVSYGDAVVDTVKGDKATVVVDNGRKRFFVRLPSSFLQQRGT